MLGGAEDCRSIVDGFCRFGLRQFGLQETEAAMATQDLNGLLLHRRRCDAQVLKAWQVWVLHVCSMKLEWKKK